MALIAPFVIMWGFSVKRYREIKGQSILRIKGDIPDGITFHDEVIISKQGSRIEAFSSHCTHLGCVINKMNNGEMVCPCHGSRFDTDGKPVKGPAVERLKRLSFEKKNGDIVIEL